VRPELFLRPRQRLAKAPHMPPRAKIPLLKGRSGAATNDGLGEADKAQPLAY
jgi:hypothetical protein